MAQILVMFIIILIINYIYDEGSLLEELKNMFK